MNFISPLTPVRPLNFRIILILIITIIIVIITIIMRDKKWWYHLRLLSFTSLNYVSN